MEKKEREYWVIHDEVIPKKGVSLTNFLIRAGYEIVTVKNWIAIYSPRPNRYQRLGVIDGEKVEVCLTDDSNLVELRKNLEFIRLLEINGISYNPE